MTRLLVRIVATLLCYLSPALLRAAEPVQAADSSELEIQLVLDNTSAREDLRRGWGFSALIDNSQLTVTTLPVKEQASNK